MTAAEWAAWAQFGAGLMTFGAAAWAVRAAYRAPKLAAEFAEQIRQDALREDEDRRLKMLIFANLMQYRAQIVSPVSVASLNLIDVAFRDDREVREAWRHFLDATEATDASGAANAKIVERYLALIEKIARCLGLSGDISVQDVQRFYYPRGLGRFDEAAWLEAEDKLRRFKAADGISAAQL
jgi:hypothetical protein